MLAPGRRIERKQLSIFDINFEGMLDELGDGDEVVRPSREAELALEIESALTFENVDAFVLRVIPDAVTRNFVKVSPTEQSKCVVGLNAIRQYGT